MSHGILQMPLILHFIGAEQDTILGIEAARLPICTSAAIDVMAGKISSKLTNVVAQISNYRTYGARCSVNAREQAYNPTW